MYSQSDYILRLKPTVFIPCVGVYAHGLSSSKVGIQIRSFYGSLDICIYLKLNISLMTTF